MTTLTLHPFKHTESLSACWTNSITWVFCSSFDMFVLCFFFLLRVDFFFSLSQQMQCLSSEPKIKWTVKVYIFIISPFIFTFEKLYALNKFNCDNVTFECKTNNEFGRSQSQRDRMREQNGHTLEIKREKVNYVDAYRSHLKTMMTMAKRVLLDALSTKEHK